MGTVTYLPVRKPAPAPCPFPEMTPEESQFWAVFRAEKARWEAARAGSTAILSVVPS